MMFDNAVDFAGHDLVWRNKPSLPVANEENKILEEELRQKKIEVEKLKLILENNINKGKNIKEHFNILSQTLSYKQQLYKSKEHELELEVHFQKLVERECSRLQQETKVVNQEIQTLLARQKQREDWIAEQKEKREKLKLDIQWDEEILLQHLEKSAQMEKDNMALLKYTSEDDSKINDLMATVERLNKEVYEMKSNLDDAHTEVLIVQTELDRIQDEFQEAYIERNDLISNWEKLINQIQQREMEVQKLSENMAKQRDEEAQLKRTLKEQNDLLSMENHRNNELDQTIKEKDIAASRLRNQVKEEQEKEESLKAELSTVRNVLNNALMKKEVAANSLRQIEKQLNLKVERIEDISNKNKEIESDIAELSKETYEAEHYTKELGDILNKETARNSKVQKEVEDLIHQILTYGHQLKDLQQKEKRTDGQVMKYQGEIQNLIKKIIALDQVRTKQESELYEIESSLEKVWRRLKKLLGETNEEERQKIEKQRSELLSSLEEKKSDLSMLTDEVKLIVDKINISKKQLEFNKKLNTELNEKIKFLNFYITNSHKTLKCSISRKEELLVQECLERFQVKKYRKMLKNRNKSVNSLQKNQLEFETMTKERTEELKHCNDLLDAEIRVGEEERRMIKMKCLECKDRASKFQDKYKVILDGLGVSEPGESAETEILIKAETQRRDLQLERDKQFTSVMKHLEELSLLKNTVWLINITNEQFRQTLHPPGINSEENELLKCTEAEGHAIGIKLHMKKQDLKKLEERIASRKDKLDEDQNFCSELKVVLRNKDSKTQSMSKELFDICVKLQRADKCNSRLSLDVRNKTSYPGILEDIDIHILREVRRIVSDLLFSAVEMMPDTCHKVQELFQEAQLPLPSRAHSSLSLRSGSVSSFKSEILSPLSSSRSSRSEALVPSVVTLGN